MAGKPKFGGKARTERIMFNVTPELLNDFKAVAFLNQQSMVERVVTLMEQDVQNRAKDIQTIRKIQQEEL